ncbi:MAG TPA: MFS transporter [Stellaceae bacterium]|nr:MFS transporter [Stellaceae bacterium]
MASTASVIEIQSFINDRRIGGFQILVVALCSLTVFLDGFDTQSVAFVAPSIAIEWHLPRAALAPIFSASLVGLLVGALLFGPVADKLGRRAVIMLSTAIFGACTLLTATSADVTQLLIFRLITGLGLGGAMPNAIALTAEYCPERRRATLVMIMFTGFSLGAAFGGALAAWLIPAFGWRSVWYVGGVVPLLFVPLQFVALPESIRFLVVKEAARDRIAALVRRIDRSFAVPAEARFEIAEARAPGVPVAHLFRGNRTSGTLLLWIMFFCNLLDVFFLQNWIPTIANSAGIPVQTAVVIGTLFQVGGVVAALLIGFAIDRYSAYPVLGVLYALGGLFVIAIGQAGSTVPALMLTTFGAGFCVVGGQNSANALAAIFYPTAMRATGVGWSLGIGRIGAILGPLIGGLLLSLHWSNGALFLFGAVPLFCAAIAVTIMGRVYGGARR